MAEKEIRVLGNSEMRAYTDEGGTLHVEGFAIRFNELSEDLGGWYERIAPGSVRLDADLRAFFDHDSSMVLGRKSAGTLDARITDDGVWVSAKPPDTQWARDLIVSMERGDINQMSFGFFCTDDVWEKRDGQTIRTVLDADVFEVSVVALPAYPTTSAQARDKAAALDEEPPAENGELEQEEQNEDDDAGRGVNPRFYDKDHLLTP
jgi:HK97 family phage prohead protease